MTLVLQILATARALEKAGQRLFRPFGLSVAQFNVLNLLADHPAGRPASHLAEALLVDPSNVTGLLNRLVRAGHLEERANPQDGRQRVVALSPAGRRLWARAAAAYADQLAAFEARFAARPRKVAAALLAEMAAAARQLP